MDRKEAERLRGRLQFASGQIFGRTFRNLLRPLTEHISRGRRSLADGTVEALKAIVDRLEQNVPRRITGHLSKYVHIYVDAAYEPSGYSGVGGVLLSPDGKCLSFFSEKVDEVFMAELAQLDRKTVIQELEALAVLVALESFKSKLDNCKVVIFTE